MVSGQVLNAFLSKSLCVIRESTGLAKPGALVPLLFPILFSILFYSILKHSCPPQKRSLWTNITVLWSWNSVNVTWSFILKPQNCRKEGHLCRPDSRSRVSAGLLVTSFFRVLQETQTTLCNSYKGKCTPVGLFGENSLDRRITLLGTLFFLCTECVLIAVNTCINNFFQSILEVLWIPASNAEKS